MHIINKNAPDPTPEKIYGSEFLQTLRILHNLLWKKDLVCKVSKGEVEISEHLQGKILAARRSSIDQR